MRIPAFFKTMRFRVSAVCLVLGLMVGGINMWLGHFNQLLWSIIVFFVAMNLGVGIIYLAVRKMLQPIDSITTLANRISHTNIKLRINREGPDDELKRLADTFDDMLNRLENAFESQRQFIQDASHELKTPITIAHSNIEAIKMQDHPSLEEYRNLVGILDRNTERMKNVYTGLVLLLEDDQYQVEFSVTDIIPIIGEVVDENKARAGSGDITFELQVDTGEFLVLGDPSRFKIAVNNLVENAIKYNRAGGSVSVAAYSENSRAVVRVKDDGIGIAEEDLQRIFDRFYCVNKSRARELGGSGLGLSIVKKIVEESKGSVSVESSLGQGSTFYITLPLYQSA